MNRPQVNRTSSPYGQLLTARFISYLESLRKAGFDGFIAPDSFREYSVSIELFREKTPLGKIRIYYSPKRKAYTAVFQGIRDRTLVTDLEALWLNETREAKRERWKAYVDGSYHKGITGYGGVILYGRQLVKEFSGKVPPEFSHSRQVGGELYAVYEVVRFGQASHIAELEIYYDYYGIEKWATGQWRTNLPLTREYARFINNANVRIHWVKVQGHSGDHWNDRADTLAREGCTS
ncbi:MAG TPA: RNase H family protein [Atribacteraceae bacterium]|nr:RNase H family protein [Atribacteraceae bacterium]